MKQAQITQLFDNIISLPRPDQDNRDIIDWLRARVPKVPGFDFQGFWHDSLLTAACAQAMAKEIQSDPYLAFSAGLLSQVGELLIHVGAPAAGLAINELRRLGCSRSDSEMEVLGVTSEDIAVSLFVHWHFSPELVQALAAGERNAFGVSDNLTGDIVLLSRYVVESRRLGRHCQDVVLGFPWYIAKDINLSEGSVRRLIDVFLSADLSTLISESPHV